MTLLKSREAFGLTNIELDENLVHTTLFPKHDFRGLVNMSDEFLQVG